MARVRSHRAAAFGLFLMVAGAAPATAQDTPASPPPAGGGDIVVEPDKPVVKPPDGDPRPAGQRAEDHARFNQCVIKMQNRDPQPFDAATPDPKAYCANKLGMSDADAVPQKIRPY